MTSNAAGQRRGRAFFSQKNFDLLLELARQWEIEADKCASVEAYYAACIVAAAAIEAMLLATCDLLPDDAREARRQLKLKRQIPRMGLGDLLRIAATAGWLVGNEGDDSKPDIVNLTDLVRRLRDLSHPGRHLREHDQAQLPAEAYDVAWNTLDLVREQIARRMGFALPPRG